MGHELPGGEILSPWISTETQPDLSDVLTQKELADFLGVTERSVGIWRIPNILIGTRRFYFKQTVVAWLKAREGKVIPVRR